MAVKLFIPDLGDFKDVEVIEIVAAVGDVVAVEDPLITLETDSKIQPTVNVRVYGQLRKRPAEKQK
mgnify:CR=1 FL=1